MENYNWINARYIGLEKERDVEVRQLGACRDMFVDKDGNNYGIKDLDFTQAQELPDFMKSFEESNKRFAEQQVEHQELINKMLSSMDANTIADHKAAIDEREYWRKLRGEIALEIIRQRGNNDYYSRTESFGTIAAMTKELFNNLYNQDKEFFKDK